MEKGFDLGSEDESYVSDALVRFARYMKKVFLNPPIKPNPSHDALFFIRAAVNYRNPKVQYYVGKIFFKGKEERRIFYK